MSINQEISILDKQFVIYKSNEEILERVSELAQKINKNYEGKIPVFVCILNGSFFFAAELLQNITLDCEISFVKLASYKGLKSTGNVKILIGLMKTLKDRDVVIIEDIVDSGRTISQMIEQLKDQQPKSIKIASLLFKKEAYIESYEIDYVGFQVENKFLVGYGLDYEEQGRNLKNLYVLKD